MVAFYGEMHLIHLMHFFLMVLQLLLHCHNAQLLQTEIVNMLNVNFISYTYVQLLANLNS